jgi:hypothetical protein
VALRQPGLHLGRIVLVSIEIVVGIQCIVGLAHIEDLMRVEVSRQVLAWNKNIRICGLGTPCAEYHCRSGQRGEVPS